VTFNDTNNGHYAVTLNGSVSPSSVTFSNNTGNYTLSGTGGIAGSGSLTLTGSGTVTMSTANSYTGGTNVNSGELIVAGASALPSDSTLTIGTASKTGVTQLATSHGTFALSGLTINSGSTLNLRSNALTISYGASDPISSIVSYLTSGYNGGAWNGTGINSSSVASANSSQNKLVYAVGYADGADGQGVVSSGVIEILPTLAGDAELKGNVVFGDFQVLANNFGKSGGWDQGNFTYGSVVNFGDFQLLAGNFGANSSGLTSGEVASLGNFAAGFGDKLVANPDGVGFSLVSVPEPASAGLLAAAGLGLLSRRKRRSR